MLYGEQKGNPGLYEFTKNVRMVDYEGYDGIYSLGLMILIKEENQREVCELIRKAGFSVV